MINAPALWNSRLFSTEELNRFQLIESNTKSQDEEFLCELVERLFTTNGKLQSLVEILQTRIEHGCDE